MPSAVYLFVMSSLACLVMCLWPPLAYLGAIAWGITLLLAGKSLSHGLLTFMTGFNILLLFGLSGSSNLFFMLGVGLPAFVMAHYLSRSRPYYDLQKRGMLAALLLVSLYLLMAYSSPGTLSTPEQESMINQYVEESLRLSEDSGFVTFYEQQGISREELKNDLALTAHWFVKHLPAFLYLQAMLAVYLVLSLGEKSSRSWNLAIMGRRPFREEIMPWQFTGVVITALSLWLAGRNEMNDLYYVGSNLLVMAVPVALYFGLANLAFLWSKLRSNLQRWLLAMFIITAIVFIPTIIFIALLGLFDSLLDYRKVSRVKEVRR